MRPVQIKGRSLVVCLVVELASPANHAIVIRHDREDSRYLELGEAYQEVVEVGRAHGTLIAPDWVLTAAHVVDGWLSPISDTVRIRERDYAVKRVVLHPSWVGDLGSGVAQLHWIDMALVQLAAPVKETPIARLYEGSDEVGQQIVFVGRGRTGDGVAGPTRSDRLLRAATNTVKRADDAWLYFDFNTPPEGTDLEGISGPGDSGNAALATVEGLRYIMGVGSRNDHHSVGLAECVYGTTEVYARVSRHLDWIRRTLASKTGPGMPLLIDASHALPDSAAGRLARDFFVRYDAGVESELVKFAEAHLSTSSRQIVSPADWGRTWAKQRQRSGPATPAYFVELRDNKLIVLAATRDHWKTYRFELEGEAPFRLRKIDVTRSQSLAGGPLPSPAEFLTQDDGGDP